MVGVIPGNPYFLSFSSAENLVAKIFAFTEPHTFQPQVATVDLNDRVHIAAVLATFQFVANLMV